MRLPTDYRPLERGPVPACRWHRECSYRLRTPCHNGLIQRAQSQNGSCQSPFVLPIWQVGSVRRRPRFPANRDLRLAAGRVTRQHSAIDDRSAIITGLGAVSPLGVGAGRFVAGLRAGRSGVRRIGFDTSRIKSRVVADCSDFDPASVMSAADQKRLPRCVPMALAAAQEAVAHAGLDIPSGDTESELADARRIGLILGTGAGGIDFTLDQAHTAYTGGEDRRGRNPSLWTITNATHGNLAGELSIRIGARGPSLCISDGCASASDAFGMAMELIRSDRAGSPECVVVVGADAHLRWETVLGMELLGVISSRDPESSGEDPATMARPFDATRDGFVLGEGAWAAVLESPRHAAARGAKHLGRLLGYGSTCDASHRVRPAPDAAEGVRAIREAIADAGLEPEDIELIHYHGTATPVNDELETRMVRKAFGEHADRLVGHSVKGAIGHPQGACGAASVVATLGAMIGLDGGEPFAPPTINLHQPDPACDLDYTPNEPRGTEARLALINCLAFGAKNSALVLERCR